MSDLKLGGAVELIVPANADMMLVIRLTSAGVIARAGLTVDVMDSLKMAVEEACNCLIGQRNPPEKIRLVFECTNDALNITAEALEGAENAEERPGVMDAAELEVVQLILSALADNVEFGVEEGWISSICVSAALGR